MGIPYPPPEYLRGADCAACYPAGETPKLLIATFTGISGCPPLEMPDDWTDPFVVGLTQDSVDNCKWSYLGEVYASLYTAVLGGGAGSGVDLYRYDERFFFDRNPAECIVSFSNENSCEEDDLFVGGTCTITPAPFPHAADAIAAAAALGLTDEDIYKWEVYPIEGSDDVVFRFVRPSRSDCIYIRWTPS